MNWAYCPLTIGALPEVFVRLTNSGRKRRL